MALSVKLTVKTDESEELLFTITTCELSRVHITRFVCRQPEYTAALKDSLVEYLKHYVVADS